VLACLVTRVGMSLLSREVSPLQGGFSARD
jgi:hypothetical protein